MACSSLFASARAMALTKRWGPVAGAACACLALDAVPYREWGPPPRQSRDRLRRCPRALRVRRHAGSHWDQRTGDCRQAPDRSDTPGTAASCGSARIGKTATDASPKVTSYTSTDRGQPLKETKGNNNTVDYPYFLDGALKTTAEKKPNGTPVSSHTYAYDPKRQQGAGRREEDERRRPRGLPVVDHGLHLRPCRVTPPVLSPHPSTAGDVIMRTIQAPSHRRGWGLPQGINRCGPTPVP